MSLPVLITSLVLFAFGVYGVVAKRDILRILVSVTIILGSITLLTVVLAQYQTSPEQVAMSYSFVLFVWSVEVIEVLIALAIFLYLARNGVVDISSLEDLKW